MQKTTIRQMMENHDAFFIDAYGVIVDASGALPGAAAFIERLTQARYSYLIVSNDASRLPPTIVKRMASFGLKIPEERILTSGMLIDAYVRKHNLHGVKTVALGGSEARMLVANTGVDLVEPHMDADASVIFACDDAGATLQQTVETVISMAMRRLDQNKPLHLVLCNPDFIYPQGKGRYGITAGTIAMMIENGLKTRYHGSCAPKFVGLGKPFHPIFEAAQKITGAKNPVMLGDQLLTDVQGAKNCKIDSCLLGTGLARICAGETPDPDPTYFLRSVLDLDVNI